MASFKEYRAKLLAEQGLTEEQMKKSSSVGKYGGFRDYREKLLADSFGQIDLAGVQSWFEEGGNTIQGLSDYHTANEGKWVSDYGADYTDSIASLRDRATAVGYYLKTHRDEFEDYASLEKAYNEYAKYFNEAGKQINSLRSFYSQFGGEDEYNAWLDDYNKYDVYFSDIDPQKAEKGWQKYLTDEAKAKANSPSFTQEALIRNFTISSDNPFNVAFNSMVYDYQRDNSDARPTDSWTEEQKNAFAQLYLESPAKAYAFARETNKRANTAKEDAQKKQIAANATKNLGAAIGSNALAYGINYLGLGMADVFNNAAKVAAGKPLGDDGFISPGEYARAVRSGTSGYLNDVSGTINGHGLGDVYSLGTSILDSWGHGITEKALGTSFQVISSFAQGAPEAMESAKARGASDEMALLYGSTIGVLDTVFERMGIDSLVKMGSASSVKGLIKNIAKQGFTEGLEELGTAVATEIVDAVMMQDKSEYNLKIAEYMAQGMTEEEASKRAFRELVDGVAYEAVAGAVSGSISGSVWSGVQTGMQNRAINKAYGGRSQSLVSDALTSTDSNVKSVAARMQNKLDKGKKLSGWNLNELITTQDKSKIKSAVEARLTELGETANVSKVADAIAKQAMGYELTALEKKAVNDSKHGYLVATEANADNVSSGALANDWAGSIGTTMYNAKAYNKGTRNTSTKAETVSATESTPANETATEAENKASVSDKKATKNKKTIEEMAADNVVSVKGFSEEASSAMVKGYDGSIEPARYSTAFTLAFEMGANGAPQSNLVRAINLGVSERVAYTAYELGKNSVLQNESKSDIIETENAEAKNESGKSIHLRGSVQRNNGENTEGQLPRVEKDSGKTEGRRDSSRSTADEEAARLVHEGREVTVADLGIPGGSKYQKIYRLEGVEETAEMKKARKAAEKRGLVVRFFAGDNLMIEAKDGRIENVRGYIQGKYVYIRADHPYYTADQIMRHELGHDMVAKGEISIKKVIKRLTELVGEENVEAVLDNYAEAYGKTGLNEAEIWEEIVCDSLGDMNIFAGDKVISEFMAPMLKDIKQATQETKGEANKTRGAPTVNVLYNKRSGKNGWGKKYGSSQEALNAAIQKVNGDLWKAFNEEFTNFAEQKNADTPITDAIIAVNEDVRQETITPIQGAKLLDEAFRTNGVKGLESIYNHATGNLYNRHLEHAKQYSTDPAEAVGKASRDIGGKVAKYLPDSKVGKANREYLRHYLLKLYSGISDGIADGIAIENGKIVFIVDSGRDNGKLDFGVRRMRKISADVGREQFIRRSNDKARSKGDISDELLGRLGYGIGSDSGRDLRRESRSKLSADQGKSSNKQSGVSGENADQRGLTKGKASRELDIDDYSQILNKRAELNKVREDIKSVEKSDDFKAIMDKISDSPDDGINAYLEWKQTSGYGDLLAKRDKLEADVNQLSKAYEDNRVNKALHAEQEAIKKSGLSEADYFRKEAEKEFGYTPYYYDAGYILPNGKMLNFSGEKGKHFGTRGEDHRAIGIIYANTQGTKALTRFMNDGNIRIMAESPGLDIAANEEPSSQQYATIKDFIYDYAKEQYFNIDLSDDNGRVIGTLEYEGKINATRIINDIKHYYETGEIRGQSEVDKFRYSRELDTEQASYAPTFYSHMGKVIDGIKIEKMGAGGVVSYLKGRGVKDEEIKWSGIETFLEGKKSVTKAELQEFVAGSQLQIEESGTKSTDATLQKVDNGIYEISLNDSNDTKIRLYENGTGVWLDTHTGADWESPEAAFKHYQGQWSRISGETRWSDYRLDGGSNYREIVFKIPNSDYSNPAMRNHWGADAKGIIAHARIQDMTTDGKKMLFVEEIQSDWHNEGHNKGYVSKLSPSEELKLQKLREEKKRLFEEMRRIAKEDGKSEEFDRIYDQEHNIGREIESMVGTDDSIPDAPFRSNYHEYVLKRLLRMAAEEGYDSIGWTTADIQSQRWSDEYAEGYRIEYDQDIPKFLRKYGKKWGATVGKETLQGVETKETLYDVNREERFDRRVDWEIHVRKELASQGLPLSEVRAVKFVQEGDYLVAYGKDGTEYDRAKVTVAGADVWSMSIPDSMKDSVLYEGQPQYSRELDLIDYINEQSDERVEIDGALTNREILANALETAAQSEEELEALKNYKKNIKELNKKAYVLSKMKEDIKRLSFAKGQKDTAKINELKAKAKKVEGSINYYDRQLLNLEANKVLKDVLAREKKAAYKRAAEKGREALHRNVEGRHKTAMRHKIKEVVNDLNNYLLKGTKDKHVPIELQKAVAEALDAVNMDTVGAEERIAKLKAEMMTAKTPEAVQDIAKKIEHIEEMGGNMAKKISRLKTAYDSIINSDDPLVANSHDDVISSTIEKVMEYVGETPLRDMSLHQLEAVYDMYRMVLHSIRAANKAFKAQKSEEISVIANRVMEEIDKLGKKKALQSKAGQAISEFDWNNQKPIYAFERIGSDTFTEVFNNVRAGEDTWAMDMSEAQDFREAQYKKHKYDSWDFKKRYGFTSASGMRFELTLDQIMSLYAYSKREQAAEHLKRGGIVFDETTEVTVKNKLGIPIKFNPTEATAYNISEETLADIISKLTAEQKAFVDEMQDYLSTVMGEKGNEVSLELYGVKLFKEKNYFPLKSATQFMAKAKEQQKGEVKIKNSGFTKETIKKANNPIVLTPFMDVWAGHVNEMSMYHAFTLALEDFYRVYNYKTPTSETMATESVEMFLQNAHGKAATKYIDQLLKDLNGGARVDSTVGIINKLTGMFKKSAVFASASVVVQQPSAIARATALVDAKYFEGKPSGKKHSETWAEIKKYAPVAVIKEMGYFDTGMGKSSVEWLKGEQTLMDKVDEIASKAPALADEYAWCAIWNAVKRETVHNNPNLKTSSDEFLKLVGKRFTEVIVKTQVYDSVLSRSAYMRSKDTGMKMATAFMAEPTTSLNMLENALIQAKRGNKKAALKAVGGVISSMILNAISVSFVLAGRDDDEEKTYAEKYISTLTKELIDSFNPLTLIPFIKDIVSIAQGYDVERSDMAVVTDLIKAWNNLDNDNRSAYRKVEDFGGAIASIFGLPVKNVMRDVRGMYNTINSFINGEKTTGVGIGNAVKEAITGKETSNGQQLYEAILKGDSAQIKRIESRFEDQKDIDAAIRKALRENDPRIKEAATAYNNGDLNTYSRIISEIAAEGHFDDELVSKAVRAEASALAPSNDAEDDSNEDKAYTIWQAKDINTALDKGNTAQAKKIIDEMIKTKEANGMDTAKAKASIKSSITSYWKPLYIAAYEKGNKAEMSRIRFILRDCGLYGNADEIVTTVNNWVK